MHIPPTNPVFALWPISFPLIQVLHSSSVTQLADWTLQQRLTRYRFSAGTIGGGHRCYEEATESGASSLLSVLLSPSLKEMDTRVRIRGSPSTLIINDAAGRGVRVRLRPLPRVVGRNSRGRFTSWQRAQMTELRLWLQVNHAYQLQNFEGQCLQALFLPYTS
ncbi:hypothetical protein MPH_04684 [Macrophomina phaseolina MS6]|uniref:Uncharacterized protein n=1 Tax=Macrophomina phaseolina (strain MS6) TaxID=1126212 RepID=K2S646_MACPH|nr:hypothetical protein MPH_04684 [Macrophomina phaseolina MS6]